MDAVQDWAAYFLGDHVGVPSYARQAFSIALTVKSWFLPLVDQLQQKPDLATIALLLLILLISFKILNMLYQTVLFWLRMAWRLVFWGGLVALALWMYTRGPDGVADDLQYWLQKWNNEYSYWKEQERAAKLLYQQPAARRSSRWY